MNKKIEKRKEERRGCLVPVESKKGTLFESSQTVDISKNGMGFIFSRLVALRKKIPIEISLTPDSEPVLVMGKVRWVRRLPGSKHYRVGMNFTDVLSGSKAQLKNVLSEIK